MMKEERPVLHSSHISRLRLLLGGGFFCQTEVENWVTFGGRCISSSGYLNYFMILNSFVDSFCRGQGGDLQILAPQALLIIQVMKKKRGNPKDRGPGLKEIKRRRSTGLAPQAHLLIIQVMTKKRENLKGPGPGLKEIERRRSTGQENRVAALMKKPVLYHSPDSSKV